MTVGQGNPGPRRRIGPIRLSSILILLIGGLGLLGVAYLASGQSSTEVYVASRDLPAYHQLTQLDIRTTRLPAGETPKGATTERDALVGRYTLRWTGAENPLLLPELGPRLPSQAIGSSVLALPANPETTLGSRLGRGDTIDILLSPGADAMEADSRRIAGALVLDLTPPPNEAVVVAVDPAAVGDVLAARGYSVYSIVRISAYSGP